MLLRWQRLKRARREMKAFSALPQSHRDIVFYAEDVHSMMHFADIIAALLARGQPVSYLTSDPEDPVLEDKRALFRAFYIGDGVVRTIGFIYLKARVLVMTMPDLENYYIKRSKVYPVHYVYLFHAMVSTHWNYRLGAFDHFDTLFCTGPHQIEEIRETERVYKLPAKDLYEDGYRRLESLIDEVGQYRRHREQAAQDLKTVVVAPSWGENSLLAICGVEVVRVLLAARFKIIVRPHPMTIRYAPKVVEGFAGFADDAAFRLDLDIRDKAALYDSDIMISDWSGVAMEYALSCERPVVFIDVPRKKNNPEAERIDIEPIESSLRTRLGGVVSPDQLHRLPAMIDELLRDGTFVPDYFKDLRTKVVFNLGHSLDGAVDKLIDVLARAKG